ncbi:hypothetical protein ThvES_00017320 [Thiovulum sp. ES]|nr:hypothetical protein ThvES_00017320 [Thiovulum sp. ES]
MKKMILISIFTVSLFSETLSNISFESGKNGEIIPKIYLPIYWSKNLFSAIKYSTSSATNSETISGFDNAKSSETVKEQAFGINILSFKKTDVNIETETTFWIAKLIFDFKAIGDLKPAFGFGEKNVKQNDFSRNEKIVKFGFEKRF